MAYADQQMSSSKIISIGLVIIIHAVIGYALVTGLAMTAVKKVASQLDMIDIQEEEELEEPEELPPPPDQPIEPPPVVTPPRIVDVPTIDRPTISSVPTAPPAPPPVAAAPPPPPPPPAAPSQARAASAKNQGRWAGRVQGTYPTRAQREEREGTVRVRLTIGANGRVAGCSVTRSSGHADLDTAACKALRRYGRYNPALNATGNPIAGSASTAVRYTMN